MEQSMTYGKKFIEGEGWVVIEAGQSAGTPVHQRPAAKTSPAILRKDFARAAADFGLVAVDADEYRELLERNRELENLLDRAGEVVTAVKDKPAAAPKPKKKNGAKGASIEEQINATESLEELSALMMDVEDAALLKLADARAELLQEGGR